jgi:hypothetical protein
MNISWDTGKLLINHNGKSLQISMDELFAMRTMDEVALECYLRTINPSRSEKEREAICEITKDLSALRNEVFCTLHGY